MTTNLVVMPPFEERFRLVELMDHDFCTLKDVQKPEARKQKTVVEIQKGTGFVSGVAGVIAAYADRSPFPRGTYGDIFSRGDAQEIEATWDHVTRYFSTTPRNVDRVRNFGVAGTTTQKLFKLSVILFRLSLLPSPEMTPGENEEGGFRALSGDPAFIPYSIRPLFLLLTPDESRKTYIARHTTNEKEGANAKPTADALCNALEKWQRALVCRTYQ